MSDIVNRATGEVASPSAPAQQANKKSGRDIVKSLLSGSKLAEIQKVAGQAFSAERVIKLFSAASLRSPKLLECDPSTILTAMVTCAELHLLPGTLGSVYLVPFFDGKAKVMKCQTIIGYRGLIELARRSGQIQTIQCECVREGDEFQYEYGLQMIFRHKPKAHYDAPITHVWALATFVGGGHQLVVLSRDEIDKIRSQSKNSDSGPWVQHFPEMAKKTAVRRLAKYLPLTIEAEEAIAKDDAASFDFEVVPGGAEVGERPNPEARLTEKIRRRAGKPDVEEPASGPQESQDEQPPEDWSDVPEGGEDAPAANGGQQTLISEPKQPSIRIRQ